MATPNRQIRAFYDEKKIRVYQAYSDTIADSALKHGTFISPPFKMDRMTWIKPSFLWMMYRSGWGQKDNRQKRVLAIDIAREGFEWALRHSCLSHFETGTYATRGEWIAAKNNSPVRVQWDPERDINLNPLDYRTIQIGLSGEAVNLYINEWIGEITEITETAAEISTLAKQGQTYIAKQKLPYERAYPTSDSLRKSLGM